MRVKFLFFFYFIFINYFFSMNLLTDPIFTYEPDNKRPHESGWSTHRPKINKNRLSPELINFHVYLAHPNISSDEFANVRRAILSHLNIDDLLYVYNQFQVVRDWPETAEFVLRVVRNNNNEDVSKLISGLDIEGFINLYSHISHHYEASNRMNHYYQRLLAGDKYSREGPAIFRNADKIKRQHLIALHLTL